MKNSEPISVAEANAMSSLALAHVGDAVYELLVRSMLAARGPAAVFFSPKALTEPPSTGRSAAFPIQPPKKEAGWHRKTPSL